MNKYIYKVRFVTSYNKNICINMNFFLANNSFNNRKIDWKQKYECFMFIQKNMLFCNFGKTSQEDDLTVNSLF